LLVALVFLLNLLAAAPVLHEHFHSDAGHADHQCAVTLFAHGQMDTAAIAVSAVTPSVLIKVTPQIVFSVFVSPVENLPAGRGPPAAASNS
jgi:hypothetical protein